MKFIQLLLIVFYCVLVERALLIDCCLSEYNSLQRALVNEVSMAVAYSNKYCFKMGCIKHM